MRKKEKHKKYYMILQNVYFAIFIERRFNYHALQSAGANPATGMDVCSHSESALSCKSGLISPRIAKTQTIVPQTKPTKPNAVPISTLGIKVKNEILPYCNTH